MSSLVRDTRIEKSNSPDTASIEQGSSGAASISVIARIDYILRFSKQTVLVVDDNTEHYSKVASQFLGSINSTVNAAFVSASIKLNDIQLRCRVIEQLFGNTLFDPEQSLAVSILRLSKNNPEKITIVIEHAHALSLQLMYELCQLSLVAKKANILINVVLLGQVQAGQLIAANKSLFNNKISLIAAESGQVISVENALFNSKVSLFSAKAWRNIVIGVSTFVLLAAATWFALAQFEHLTFSRLPLFNTSTTDNTVDTATQDALVLAALTADNNASSEQTVSESKEQTLSDKRMLQKDTSITLKSVEKRVKIGSEQANAEDVYQALLGNNVSQSSEKMAAAQPQDIIETLNVSFMAPITTSESTSTEPLLTAASIDNLPLALTPNYYLSSTQGYVVQLAGFTDKQVLKQFILAHSGLSYFSYQRVLKDQRYIVLTSKVFPTKAQALAAINELPSAIIQKGPWVKRLSTIQQEIKTFKTNN